MTPDAAMASPYAPSPAAAPALRRVLAQAGLELRITLRNGEQLLLSLVIPLVLMVALARGPLTVEGGIDSLAPGVLALAVMSSSFTGLAIGTGFERRYGVLKRLGATPLGRGGLLAGKALAVVGLQVVQIALVCAAAYALGWRPAVSWPATLATLVLGSACFAGLGMLMAGVLRAEATLAAANLVWFLLVLGGGIVVALSDYPAGLQGPLALLPSAALAEGLRSALGGGGLDEQAVAVLVAWSAVGYGLAARTFRWD
jgi:ABC-2 type transport system permease protein